MKKLLFLLVFFTFGAYAQQSPQQIKFRTGTGGIPLKTTSSSSFIKVGNVVTNVATGAGNGSFSYPVAANQARSSAGVYNGETLVRTLWGNKPETPGIKQAQWDGNLDDGTPAPLGNYNVKVLCSNVQYDWEGGIGNTSADKTGYYFHKGQGIQDMCFVGTKAFYPTGSSEHQSAQKCFLTTDIQRLINGLHLVTGQASARVCTDGNILYWSGGSRNYSATLNRDQYNYYVFGANPADNCDTDPAKTVSFVNGPPINDFNTGTGSVSYPSVISAVLDNPNAEVGSMCVQKNGNLLFVARPGLNQLQIVDKRPSSGATLKTLTYSNVSAVACDNSGNLYMVYNNVLHKLSVTTAGVLTDLNIPFNGLVSPGFIDVSPDGNTIAVADQATRQVKFYSVSGGSALNTLGTGVSYSTNPYAADNKFFYINFVKYQPDGSLWVGDIDNSRYQRFNPDFTYKDNIAFLRNSRSCAIDQNDPKRIFSNFLEFERDYSKALAGTNGSWKLKANWAADYPITDYTGFANVLTYSLNGRTYGSVYLINDGTGFEAELTPTGLRKTGAGGIGKIGRDGTVFDGVNVDFDRQAMYKRVLTGFTPEGNPIRSSGTLFVTAPDATQNFYSPANGYEQGSSQTADADRYIFFNCMSPPQDGQDPDRILGYHLGAMKPNSRQFLWKTSQSTSTSYSGGYPTNGDFDIGNGWPAQHSSTHAMVYGHDIFFNVNGEFWKNSEINIWNHFNDDGLPIGHFGVSGGNIGDAGVAGNALATGMAKVGNDYYIVHVDESVHAFLHSWHVSGLNTITEQTIPMTVSAPITIALDPTSLMGGIQYKSTFTGGSGWTVDQPTTGLNMATSVALYRRDSVDLRISGIGTQVVRRSLNNNASLSGWALSGGIGMQNAYATDPYGNSNYLEVLDVSGKIIARFEGFCDVPHGYYTYLRVNNSYIVAQGSVNDAYYAVMWNFQNFSFNYAAGVLTFKLGGYSPVTVSTTLDAGADKSAPAYLRVSQKGANNMVMELYKLRFVPTAVLPQ